MAAQTTMYNNGRKHIASAEIDYLDDTIKVALLTSGYTPNQAHEWFSDVSGSEVSANGYTAGGATLGTKTLALNGNSYACRAAFTRWTAGVGGITARYALVYKSTGTPTTSALICYVLLDTTPGDITKAEGQNFDINWDATAGVYFL